MSTAWVSGAFALGGVALGALLAEIRAALTDRRVAKRNARVAARLAGEDFTRCSTLMRLAGMARSWDMIELEQLSLEDWEEHRLELAGALSRQEWRLLRICVRRIYFVRSASTKRTGPMNDRDVEKFMRAADMAEQCMVMLDGVADAGLGSRKRPKTTADTIRPNLFTDADTIAELQAVAAAGEAAAKAADPPDEADINTAEADEGAPGEQ